MKKILLVALIGCFSLLANAQLSRVSLQASGLTCSMCSKAILNALQKVPFVEKVQVNIKNQQYNITFKEGNAVDFDLLSKAVVDAGFSVASFTVTANLHGVQAQKDEHISIGDQYFHFLNGSGQQLNGETTFTLVDKSFTTAKNYKKYSALSKMECVQTGRMAKCCAKEGTTSGTRIYHAII